MAKKDVKKDKLSIKEQMELMKQQSMLDTPPFDVSSHAGIPSNTSEDIIGITNIKPLAPVDYEKVLRDSEIEAEQRIKLMANVLMGNDILLKEPWIKEKIQIDVDRLARATKAIVTFGKKIDTVHGNIDAFPEDERWYKVLIGMQDTQNKNVKHRDSLLKSMQDEYDGILMKYQQMYPEKFAQEHSVENMNVVDPAAFNEVIARAKAEEKKQRQKEEKAKREKEEARRMKEMQLELDKLQEQGQEEAEEKEEDVDK